MPSTRQQRNRHTAWSLALVLSAAAFVATIAPAHASTDADGCLDHHSLAMEALGGDSFSAPMSFARSWSVSQSLDLIIDVDADGDVFAYGMSCDGPWSCSPQLVFAIEQAQRMIGSGNQGPMCLPGDPDCNVSPGHQTPTSIFQINAPLVPFLTDAAPRPPATVSQAMTINSTEQALHPSDVVRRFERPPRLR